jgi:hypothetical protein
MQKLTYNAPACFVFDIATKHPILCGSLMETEINNVEFDGDFNARESSDFWIDDDADF